MTDRERYVAVMNFEKFDRFPLWHAGPWDETLVRWRKEGLPEDEALEDYFGGDRVKYLPVLFGLYPRFERTTLCEEGDTRIVKTEIGIIQREKVEHSFWAMPQFLDYPIKNRDDFEKMKERYNPEDDGRFGTEYEELLREAPDRDYVLILSGGRDISLFGALRDWCGLEHLSVLFYDDPGLVHDMMEFVADFCVVLLARVLSQITPDAVYVWEDMAYKTSSLISPKMFREFMLPRYRRLTDCIRSFGVSKIFVDSDGDVNGLIPLFLEGGVNGLSPLEINSGMDPIQLRRNLDSRLLMFGGIDKKKLSRDRREVYDEVMPKLEFFARSGGYIPMVDHSIPPDVPFENYAYMVELISAMRT
ncbi:MAG: uroporphyrinogen decarboxylase family protein [Armatimonadetes bacterium]|nr:uroporphyrinogen decarboxylase family protein [Armatimonadota bacterium]